MKYSHSSAGTFCGLMPVHTAKPPHTKGSRIRLKDPASAITHLIAFIGSALAAIPLCVRTLQTGNPITIAAMLVFSFSMAALYAASTCYHSFDTNESANTIRKKIDHMMIFVLIAGSYTPICLLPLRESGGMTLLAVVWGIAALGCVLKLFWVYCPKWVSSVLYIAMGWVCIFAFPALWETLSRAQFSWLLAGGIIYTIGGVIYALKLPLFNCRHAYFDSHAIFHLFVMSGSLCHFIVMFLLV